MKKIYNVSMASLCLLFLTAGCFNDNIESLYPTSNQCDTVDVSYSAIVKPILDNQCVSCHNESNASGGVDLSTYTATKTYADNGKLVSSIKQDGSASAMPQGADKLDQCYIDRIESWVNAGAKNN